MMPAMWGEAIDVPEIVSVWLSGMKPVAFTVWQPVVVVPLQVMPVWVEVMFRPGAAMSGLRRSPGASRMRRGPREEKLARVSAPLAPFKVMLTGGVVLIVFLMRVPSASVARTEG